MTARLFVVIGLMLVDKSEVVQQLPTTDTSTVITLLLCLLGLGGARTIEKAELKNSTISSVIQWIAATTTSGIIAFAIKQLF